MSQFQVLYKRKIVPPTLKENLDIERRCNCLEFRRTKRSQAFDSRRGFVFEDPEPLEPVKTKVNPSVRKNKLHKYTTKKVAVKKQPPPFLVGKVRHKIHSPPFLHGPNVATEPKKRIPLTPIQSFAPKNYKFKANYISKAPVMAMTTTPSKLNNSPFTLESILNKNKNAKSNNKDKENYFKNVTVRSQRRRELKDSPTTMNQLVPGKPVFVFGRRNLEEEFKKLSKNPTKDSINFEMKTVKESQSSAKKENVFNMFNNVGKLSTKMAKVFSFETETIRLMNTEHQNHEDKSQMLSPNLSAIIYSPTDSTPIYSNKCHINVYTSPQTEKKDLAEKGSDNEDLNSDSTSPTLNQTAIDLDSTVNSASNQQISPAKNHQEYSPKLPDITSPTVISNKESDNKSDLEDNQYKAMSRSVENKTENHPCQPDLIELNLLEKISKTSMSDVPVSEDNVNLVVSASIETNSSDFNQPHKDVEVSGLDSLSRLSLSYPEKRENMGILRQSSQTQHQESNNVANEQIEILKTSMSDVLVSEDNVNLVVSASIETNLSDFNQPHKDVEVSGLDSLSRLSLSSPEKRKSTGIISQSPQTQIQACDNVVNVQNEILKTSVTDMPILEDNDNLVVSASIETNSSDVNQPHEDVEENELNSLSRLSLSSPEKRENMGILRRSSQTQHQESNNVANEQIEILKTSMSDLPVSEDNVNLVVSASIETNLSDFNQPHKDVEVSGLDSLSRLSLSSPEKRKSTGIISQSPQTQIQACDNVANVQNEILKTSVTGIPILEDNDNLVVSASIETNSSDFNQPHKDVEVSGLDSLSRLSLSYPEKREYVDISPQTPLAHLRASHNASSIQDVNVNIRKSDELTTFDTTRLSFSFKNMANETSSKQSHKKVAKTTSENNVLSQLSMSSLENKKNGTNLPKSSKFETRTCEENKSIDEKMPNLSHGSPRLPRSVKAVSSHAQLLEQSPVRVLRGRIIDVTPSPQRTPKKRNVTPCKSPYSLLSSKVYSPKHLAISPLKVLNLRNRDIAVTPSPTKLTPRKLRKPHTDVQEIDEDDSPIVLSINKTTKCKSLTSPQMESLISVEKNSTSKPEGNSPSKQINTQIPFSKNSSQVENVASMIKMNNKDLHAGTASAHSVVASPLIISLVESPIKKEPMSKPLIKYISSTVEDESTVQTIDLVSSDDEDEPSTLLKNILQKYSSINTPSPKSKGKSLTPTQKVPVDEEEHSTFLSNILKKYSSVNTPSPKSKDRSVLAPIGNLPIIRISPSRSPCLREVPSPQKIGSSPLRTLALRRRLVDLTPSPKKTPKKKINVTPCKSPRPALHFTKESSPQQIESPLRVLCLRKRDVAVTPSPKKSTPRGRKK
ncbi:uncharacterized protein LOC100678812 isoform X3 [Nasonia vitripennis]|uniref:Uncharacterized protein n=1 Tax=Nasonia vitripennis TaxID=7425 RepID=A0A7M7ILR6_NASVI|nr:uncharacterized protein LOC100678812 isoform X3 [Nasonia vitripennis]